jgi:hypothetical protein
MNGFATSDKILIVSQKISDKGGRGSRLCRKWRPHTRKVATELSGSATGVPSEYAREVSRVTERDVESDLLDRSVSAM